jgi:hypothetical protein
MRKDALRLALAVFSALMLAVIARPASAAPS